MELTNGHEWKRQKDGTWCRFSEPKGDNCLPPDAQELVDTVNKDAEDIIAETGKEPTVNVDDPSVKADEKFTSATDKAFGLTQSLDEIREQYGDLGVKVVTETEQKAQDIIGSGASKNQRGPVVSGVTDPITQETYFGQNFTKGQRTNGEFDKFKKELHPYLKTKLENYEQKLKNGEIQASDDDIARAGLPGSHSEIVAIDKTLKAIEKKLGKELSDSEVSELLPQLLLHNRSLKNPDGVPPRCVNCFNITEGITVIGND